MPDQKAAKSSLAPMRAPDVDSDAARGRMQSSGNITRSRPYIFMSAVVKSSAWEALGCMYSPPRVSAGDGGLQALEELDQ